MPGADELPHVDGIDRDVALRRALRATTLLLGRPLTPKPHSELLLLHREPVKLQKQALHRPTLLSADGQEAILDYSRRDNTIYPELTPGEYEVRYQIGFEEGKLPAVVREIIVLMGTWFMLKSDSTKQEILALLPIARNLR